MLFEPYLDADGVRRLATAVAGCCGGCAAVFSDQGNSFKYALCHPDGNLKALGQALNQALQGRGGGKPNLIQGSVQADELEIRAFFAAQSIPFQAG